MIATMEHVRFLRNDTLFERGEKTTKCYIVFNGPVHHSPAALQCAL